MISSTTRNIISRLTVNTNYQYSFRSIVYSKSIVIRDSSSSQQSLQHRSSSSFSYNQLNRFNNNNTLNYIKRYYSSEELPLPIYHTIVDDELELFSDRIEVLIQSFEDKGADVETSDGVLTINLGKNGTYVINKQTPNRQIWWSSPISGPKRFNYDTISKQWIDNIDGTPLRNLLQSEIKTLCKYDLNLDN
ncbi:frataxin [Heterostelium album PN500]|uniref:ferroxidase n=1 Tax=Heterostelium pallidum (strain ATCC 26659 / Pp 5 / PN500) TaxID=670386 RepID=D3BU32_HETP5|nr:frataxin [Heterostelium album PN500]EFA75218.1 frataxin [Heterostelium album PN500]|eukprot:XP_020427352.1 frataxin [Heterostelium album PN500]